VKRESGKGKGLTKSGLCNSTQTRAGTPGLTTTFSVTRPAGGGLALCGHFYTFVAIIWDSLSLILKGSSSPTKRERKSPTVDVQVKFNIHYHFLACWEKRRG
jgi:hypothetical protein